MKTPLKILVVCSSTSLVSGFVTLQAVGGPEGVSKHIGTYESSLPMCAAPVGLSSYMEIDTADTVRLDDAQPAVGSRFEVDQSPSNTDIALLYVSGGDSPQTREDSAEPK